MKTLVLTTVLVVLSTLTYAQSEKENADKAKTVDSESVICNLYPSSDDQVTLKLRKETGDKVTVKVKEDNGSLVYRKRIKKANNNKITYDIAQFPNGSYIFEVTKDKKVVYSKVIRKGEGMLIVSN
ncbi:MAG: T9SS type A sorting domain-containing protein [Bacteroidetes bacterium]|nr:T9SS type A sorting domain-containing protein [Bacteroidota bacterium]MBL7103705.1 T9SS type A sorting domain-containing protein [Bacteroidales bacterium]